MGTSQERVFTVFQTYLTLSVDPFYQSLFFHHPEKKCFIYYRSYQRAYQHHNEQNQYI